MATTENTTVTSGDNANIVLYNNNDIVTKEFIRSSILAAIPKASDKTIQTVTNNVTTFKDLREFIEKGKLNGKFYKIPFEEMNQTRNEVVAGPGGMGNLFKVGFRAIAAQFAKKEAKDVAEKVAPKLLEDIIKETRAKFPGWSDAAVNEFAQTEAAAQTAGTVSKAGLASRATKWAKANPKKALAAGVFGTGAGANMIGNFFGGSNTSSTKTTASSSSTPSADSLSANGKTAQTALDAVYNAGGNVADAITTMQAAGTKLTQEDINYFQIRYQTTVTPASTTTPATVGVYLGGGGVTTPSKVDVPSASMPGGYKPAPKATTTGTGLVDLIKYKQSFPVIGTPEYNAFYQKVTAAGYRISGNNPYNDLKTIWNDLGQISLDSSRQGKMITPDQILQFQKAAFGGGGGNTTTNTTFSPTSKADVKKMLNAQLQSLTGRTATDAQLEAFYNSVHKKEMTKGTKTVSTTTNGNTKTVVTPGYSGQDILTDAEKIAQQDPMYKQLQHANVFGDAIAQALGVK